MFDCIVIGSGPAGAAAAYHLAAKGRSVLVLEKDALSGVKPCGGAISPQIAQWFDFDFSPAINNRVRHVRFTYEGGDAVDVPLEARESLWLVRREVFDAFLVNKARDRGAVIKYRCAALSVKFHHSAWTVETPEGPFQARYLIAADGAKGNISKWLGITPPCRQVAAAIEAECAIPAQTALRVKDDATQPTAPMCLDFGRVKQGYLWNFPKTDGQSLGLGVFLGRQKKDLRGILKTYAATFGIDLDACTVAAHPLALWDGHQVLHTQQALIAGEAACMVDPFTAEGIRPALRTGVLAAEAIHEVMSGHHLSLDIYTSRVQQEIGTEMMWARRLSALFYRLPSVGYALGVKHPGTAHTMARLGCGELRYSEVAQRALNRMGRGIFQGFPAK